MMFTGTWRLLALIVRRDRIRIPIWLFALTLMTIVTAPSFEGLYKTQQERQIMAETMKNPAMTAMVGRGYGLDHYTTGAMMAHQMLLFTAIAVAIMSILLVARHTRADEEAGMIEMIRSLPAGRLSNLSSTLVVMIAVNLVLAAATGLGLAALRIGSMDMEGSLLYGAALAAAGIFFTAVTALFAQLSENSRGTIGLSFAVLGISYLLRAIGDVSSGTLSWFSPLGWVLGAEVYVNNYWWPVVLTIAAALAIMALALYLNSIRDVGSGFLPSKRGRSHASAFLQGPIGLGLRLQRTAIVSWAIGVLLLGISYGSVLGDLEEFIGGNEMLAEMVSPAEGDTLTEQFMTMLMSVISMICTIPPLMMALKLRSEEKKNRTEHLLVRAVSRTRLMGSYLAIALGVGISMQVLAVFGLWAAGSAVMEEAISFTTMLEAALAYLPAMWVMTGVALLLIGILPQMTSLTWLYLGYSFIVVYMGELLQFPEWMGKLSPFGHIPQLPVEEFDTAKVFLLVLLAAGLMLAGFIGYNKRDLQG
ncbi:ABC transporter permease [Bacillus sp. FJAT-27251]|uniref:ABC transporter permease n=1 Tax=Bacillus sp. FJAT-27251 TaxID=1684142 RepID=UPI0006A7D3E9|nr:ABC transporter permease [Bacillus sp. FJAT-27251]